mmetsp:Transcript_2771/g.4144  ORF Transcript_2771/g.4144 Transcript_2771/m.4144 type:complete len:206 (+) Transcript_2771:1139-1756(+)|eukprot:CAMPEP_0178926528 /NCGR_PEP_ID=MMETSP0786-20121207/18592_1 /TAXON_ID=186022 /ORGANISM="Thalassionema frauenfeldii, Strain CCMP 1798" /LENGTH=205 /DNA_ID=CAMNT_0020601679 /DNA_START=1689 /DNA_END=2306 /DNA_ORIENTATION=-
MSSQQPPELFDFLNSSPAPMPPTIEEEVLAGLSPAEQKAIVDEQKQIMQQLDAGRNAAMEFERRSAAASIQSVGAEESVLAAVRDAEAAEDAKIAAKIQEIEDRAAKRVKEKHRAREAHEKLMKGDSWLDYFSVSGPASENNDFKGSRSSGPITRAPPRNSGGGGGARVAQPQSIFACLGTSVSNVVNGTPASGGSSDMSYSLLS